MFAQFPVVIKGAGDVASGVAARLWRAGFPVVMTELPAPLAVRRTVSFCEAVYSGSMRVEDITALCCSDLPAVQTAWRQGLLPVVVDSTRDVIPSLRPWAVVDAILAKRNTGTQIDDAPLVIGLGPGFEAGRDVHAVVETNRGHCLGRVYWLGSAQPDTGIPGSVDGFTRERVIYAETAGVFQPAASIGDRVLAGDLVGTVGDTPVRAGIAGVLRGLIHGGVGVMPRVKLGDVDPRAEREHCFTISDKALAVGGGVLEALLSFYSRV